MGRMAHWIDERTDEERDRIITGQGWCAESLIDFSTGNRCLLGHAGHHASLEDMRVAFRFDDIARRWGLDRAVRIAKARAARRNRVEVPAASPELVEVA